MIALAVVLLIALAVGVPLLFALGLAAWVGLGGLPMTVLVEQMISTLNVFTLVAIPLFLLMGQIMTHAGITGSIVGFANALLGRFRGGLALANIGAGIFFAGISGSAVADTTAIGSIMIPAMKREGYGGGFAGAVTAAAGALGPIIPPSILMVIYGVQTSTSIEGLFLGGVLPGLFMGAGLVAVTGFVARRRDYPVHPAVGVREGMRAFLIALPALFLPFIIVFGIVTGVFTVTESAAIAVLYAIAYTLVIAVWRRRFSIRTFVHLFGRSALETAVVAVVIAASAAVAWPLTRSQVPQATVEWMQVTVGDPFLILLLINAFLIVLGMFLAPAAGVILATPLIEPLARSIGMDPIQIGVMVVFNLNLGILTPPVGLSLFITARIAGTSFAEQVKEVLPFLAVGMVTLALVTYWPAFTLWLPQIVAN